MSDRLDTIETLSTDAAVAEKKATEARKRHDKAVGALRSKQHDFQELIGLKRRKLVLPKISLRNAWVRGAVIVAVLMSVLTLGFGIFVGATAVGVLWGVAVAMALIVLFMVGMFLTIGWLVTGKWEV